jgi:hypothetical protein
MEVDMAKKMMLVGLVVMMLAVLVPVASASAAPLNVTPTPGSDAHPRVEKAFQRVKTWYDLQGKFLTKSADFISKAEKFIAKAQSKGLDTSSLQSLLDAFANSIPAVQAAHEQAGAIISAHNGFDAAGKVTDLQAAIQTVKDAAAALQEGRQAHLGKGKALAQAIRAFWLANRPQHATTGETGTPAPVPTGP